jgi:chorismate synthase
MNNFGKLLQMSIYGESHGNCVGCVIDGCPAGIELTIEELLKDIAKRKSGTKGTTPRKEDDLPSIASGYFNNKTTGAPINIQFQNKNTISSDYSEFINHPRPGHSDFVAWKKYKGFADFRGGGHFSGRLTLPIVASGVIAKKILNGISFSTKILSLGGNSNIEEQLNKSIEKKDSVGGIIECSVNNLPIGLGEPFFDSVESLISHGIFSIPGIKAIEFGNGFACANLTGSENNDVIINKKGETKTNNCGGVNGGISNGNPLVFRVAVKPTSSISLPQNTYNFQEEKITELIIKGRHDVAFILRAPVVIEAITAFILADLYLQNKTKE